MKATITSSEIKKGLFKKKTYYVVELKVSFSEEEKELLQQPAYIDLIVHEQEPDVFDRKTSLAKSDPGIYNIRIRTLLSYGERGLPYHLEILNKVPAYERALEGSLTEFKGFIEENLTPLELGTRTLDL